MTGPQRDRLAEAQAELLRALLADGAPPAGFDPERLRVEANALRSKRRRVVAMIEPDACAELEDRFVPLFDEYARTHPKPTSTRAREDARAFVTWLREQGHSAKPRWWQRWRATNSR
ncbi:hypothetical protein JOF56_011240 [Kibdelosporangium banguiense]|uniref:SCO6045-like C-terminal domain-containing protein n=1 Tax=Kibdelosporangium banguiense TaxID=1365924 RepID=A0ABS4U2H9_9PSEU|nr:hypothetical protein [Kibdelosporangium banguiense]MBP2330855.1 hypothetical protein [Kibdelosporangium banguiense]